MQWWMPVGVEEIVGIFGECLVAKGRSNYTIRTYRLASTHFLRWLSPRPLDSVERSVIATYVGEFVQGVDRDGHPRAARTINHRLAASAAFFGFLIDRDGAAGQGPWLGRTNPVPIDAGLVTHSMPGRDSPRRTGLEMRWREPRDLDPVLAEHIAVQPKWGQRSGDPYPAAAHGPTDR